MGIEAERTVTQYGIGEKALIKMRGSGVNDLEANLRIYLYNDANELNSDQLLDLALTTSQKQALISLVQARLQELENETGWTRYEPGTGIEP